MNHTNIPFNDLKTLTQPIREQIDTTLKRVIESGWFVLGPNVGAFEESFAKYLNVAHVAGVANGTDAIEIAIKSLGIKRGDFVGTAMNAGGYSTSAILAANAVPFAIDCCQSSSCIEITGVTKAIEAGCRAIIITHLYGRTAPGIEEIARICRNNNVLLIEDCAQAHGSSINGIKAGAFGDIASFSFYPTKNLGALGDGGAIATNNLEFAERAKKLRQYGWREKYVNHEWGGRNSRLDELQAAYLQVALTQLDQWNSARREIADYYIRNINHPLVQVPTYSPESHVYHLFVIKTDKRKALRTHLATSGVSTEIHYPIPDHHQVNHSTAIKNISLLPNAELESQRVLSIPCYPGLCTKKVKHVTEAINNWQA